MASKPGVAIRLNTEGKAGVKSDFAEIRQAGERTFDGIGDSARQLGQEASREAERIASAYERAASRADRAFDVAFDADRRRAAQAAKLSAIMPKTALQMQIENASGSYAGGGRVEQDLGAASGLPQFEGSARASAYAIQELLNREEALIAKATALKAVLDPVTAAQNRFNAEMAELKAMAPHLTVDELAQAEARLKMELDSTVNSHQRATTASGAFRAGMQQAGYQVQDFFVQVAGGTDAVRAFSMQAPQFIGSLQVMSSGAETGGSKFATFARILGGPWGVALGIGIPLVGMLAENILSGGDAAEKASKSTLSLADAQTEVNRVMALDKSGDVAAAARELAGARMQQAVSTLQAARAEAALAQAAARKRLDDIADGAEQRQVTRIEVVPGSRARRTVTTTEDVPIDDRRARGQGSLLDRERREAQQQYDASSASLERYDNILNRVSTTTLRVALTNDSSLRDARLKLATATDAVGRATAQRDIIEREARIRMEATQAGTAARTAAEAEYTKVVKAANLEVEQVRDRERNAGQSRRDASKAAREAAKDQRELDQALASLEKRFDPTAAAAREYKEELEQISALATKGMISSDVATNWRAQSRANAFLPDLKDRLAPFVADEEAEQERKNRLKEIYEQGSDQLQLAQLELVYRGRIGAQEARILELERFRIDLKRQNATISDEELAKLVAQRAELLDLTEILDRQHAAWEELTDAGEHMVDTVLNPDNFRDWGDAGKSILQELRNELWKLAAINPLKNLISGGSLPTLFGSGGLAGLLGGSSATALGTAIGINDLRGLAAAEAGGAAIGTEYASGGATWLAENGPELVQLPRGSKVTPAAETRRILSNGGNGSPVIFAPDLRYAVMTEDLLMQMQTMAAAAGQYGASEGASRALAESRYGSSRSLEGR